MRRGSQYFCNLFSQLLQECSDSNKCKVFLQEIYQLVPSNEVDFPERETFIMTSLGKLVFVDIHHRLRSSSSSEELSIDYIESLSLAFENLFYMPFDIIDNYSTTVSTLDISYNKFSRSLHFLSEFANLTSLNLDHNNIDAYTIFPRMPKLQLIWLNHNNIDDLYPFIKNLHESFPNLRYLCLMGNKAAPSYLNGGSFYDYLQYRLFVISWFPYLVHLDDRVVTPEQREEANRLFRRPIFDSLNEYKVLPACIKHLHCKITDVLVKPILPDKLKTPKKGWNFII